jgi:hypothetical protein
MSTKILFRRDTSANWTTVNPILLAGEIGIETDTYKFKIGNGSRWNQQPFYAFKVGAPNGVAQLGATGKIPLDQVPDYQSVNTEVTQKVNEKFAAQTTSNLAEGQNLYFTEARAIAANATAISHAVSDEATARNQAIATAKNEAIATAASNTTSAIATARTGIISQAYGDATDIASALIQQESAARVSEIAAAIEQEESDRNSAINTAISNEIINRNTAINSTTTTQIAEGDNLYFTEARAKSAVASDIATAVAGVSLTGKTTNNLAEGSTNLYFTNARAISATNSRFTQATIYTNQVADDLRTEISQNYVSNSGLQNQLDSYVLEGDRNAAGGFAGLDSSSKVLDSVLPSTIARVSDIDAAIDAIIDSAPGALDTLNELAAELANGQSAVASLTNVINTKLDSSLASTTYAPKANPTFTGTVSGVTKTHVGLGNVDNTSDLNKPISLLTDAALDLKANINNPTFTGSIDFSNVTVTGLTAIAGLPDQSSNSGKYLMTNGVNPSWETLDVSALAPLDNPTFTGTVSFQNATVNFADSSITSSSLAGTIPNAKLENSSITLNGNLINLGSTVTLGGYYNPAGENVRNKIIYGTSVDAPAGSYSAGDIYIQY